MTWESDIAALPNDRERVEYLIEELRRRDAEGCALYSSVRAAFGLSPSEARIVVRLARSRGNAVPYDLLLDSISPREGTQNAMRSLHVFLVGIRRKLRNSSATIKTVHAYGVRMDDPDNLFESQRSASDNNAPTGSDAGTTTGEQNA